MALGKMKTVFQLEGIGESHLPKRRCDLHDNGKNKSSLNNL